MSALTLLRDAARRIKLDAMTVYFAARDPRTPIPVRMLALAVAAYALSPIDLIPDFIPVLGYLDDVILVPLGIMVVIRWTPAEVIEASRAKARSIAAKPPTHIATAVIVGIWVLCAAGFGHWLLSISRR